MHRSVFSFLKELDSFTFFFKLVVIFFFIFLFNKDMDTRIIFFYPKKFIRASKCRGGVRRMQDLRFVQIHNPFTFANTQKMHTYENILLSMPEGVEGGWCKVMVS